MVNTRWGLGTETIRSEKLVYRKRKKVIYVDLKKNKDGQFLKITEACHGRRDTVVIPDVLMEAFSMAIEKVKGGK